MGSPTSIHGHVGQEDIESLNSSIQLYSKRLPQSTPGVSSALHPILDAITDLQQVLIAPLYAALPSAQQSKIFSSTPKGMRKCILATNIAETSITIPGVKYVIDTGKCKEKRYIARSVGSGMSNVTG